MTFSEPLPFQEALDSREVKSLLPTELSSRELKAIAPELRERAMFSARVTNAGFLQRADELIGELIEGKTDKAASRLKLSQALQEMGYSPEQDKAGTIEDLSSNSRLNLILETNTQMAQGYGYWKQGQDPDVLDEFPAQELFRAEERKTQRDWASRWSDAGGEFFGGRMIALKNDPIWSEISAFGLPYAPFDFNSGMDVQDISRDEAEELGLIEPHESVEPEDRGFNEDLQADVSSFSDEPLQRALVDSLGEGFQFLQGILKKI